MGRFDALIHIEEQKKNTPPAVVPPVEHAPSSTAQKEQKQDRALDEGIAKKPKGKKSESQQNDKSTNHQSDTSGISTKTSKRFTTYLTIESLKEIRGIAVDEDRHDYDVFQEAIDFYLRNRRK